MIKFSQFLILSFFFISSIQQSSNEYKPVIKLVSQRLDLAQPVALYKWQNNQSIDDPVREAALLANVASQANATGLSVQFAQQFFQDQINASKIIQVPHIFPHKFIQFFLFSISSHISTFGKRMGPQMRRRPI
jgi:chorismate mutase-like protein